MEDGSFDVVLSSFAAIFAPRHDLVASELVRVCRGGGTIGMTAWTPDGTNNEVFSTLADRLPPAPEFVTPSILWGDPNHVRSLFAPHDVTLRIERPAFEVVYESVEALEAFAFENSSGLAAARDALTGLGRWDAAHAAMRQALDRTNQAQDGSYRVDWDFLLIVADKAV